MHVDSITPAMNSVDQVLRVLLRLDLLTPLANKKIDWGCIGRATGDMLDE